MTSARAERRHLRWTNTKTGPLPSPACVDCLRLHHDQATMLRDVAVQVAASKPGMVPWAVVRRITTRYHRAGHRMPQETP